MALQVWLPLNGDLINRGLNNDITISCNNESYYNNGKIGKCFNSTSDININIPSLNGSKIWSVCFWGYANSSLITSDWTKILVIHDNGSSLRVEVCPKTFGYGKTCYCVTNNYSFLISNRLDDLSINDNNNYYDQWVHFCLTCDGTTISRYMNGVLIGTAPYNGTGTINGLFSLQYNQIIMKNDFRIYDHCLSIKEIKEISKGLVLHYKLDSVYDTGVLNKYSGDTAEGKCSSSVFTVTKLKNERGYNYKLSVTGNGASHWEGILFPCFSFTANKRYYWSCKIRINSCSNMSLYFRAARIINDWSTDNIGVGRVTNEWKEIVLTRTIPATFSDRTGSEEVSNPDLEFMTNDMIENGKVYYMDIDIKDVQVIESDVYMPFIDNTMVDNVVYDVSGYGNNGTRIGTNMIYNTDTPRYNSCIKIADNTSHIVTPVMDMDGFADSYTISWWEKASGINTVMPWGFSNGNRLNVFHNNYLCCNTGDSESNKFSPPIHINSVIDNNWHHMVLTGDGSENKLYIDGKYMATAPTYRKITGSQIYLSSWSTETIYAWLNGSLSDFRIYATVLSDEDIKKLYNVSAFVDNEGNVYSYNFDDSIDHLKVNNKGIFNHGNFYESANYMDMKTLTLDTGEVFVRILHHNCQNGTVYFTRENVLDIQSEHLYSRLGLMENYRMPDGKFEFLATQSNDTNLYRWKQSSNPVISETLEGFESITGNNNGLCKNPYSAACAISNRYNNWWCAIGSWSNYNNAIPGFSNKEVNEINLYVRVCPEMFRSFSNYLTCNTINEI